MSGKPVDASTRPPPRSHWLLVAYYAHCENRASSHHVADRLDEFAACGIDITLLSSPCGASYGSRVRHLRAPSLSPSGFLYELGHRFRRARRARGGARAVQLVGVALCLPLAVAAVLLRPLERLASRHDKRWLWWLPAVARAWPHLRRRPPDVVYTIGGPSSSHEAGRRLARLAGARLVCQFQDPLRFQYPPSHPWRHRFHERFERTLAAEAELLVFLTAAAAASARERLPAGTAVFANLAGAVPRPTGTSGRVVPAVSGRGGPSDATMTAREDIGRFRAEAGADTDADAGAGIGVDTGAEARFPSGEPRTIAHLGTLAGARNLDTLLAALTRMADDDPHLGERFRLRLAGTLDRHVRESIDAFVARDSIEVLGKLERQAALELADESDVLLLMQGHEAVSLETIPSKAYEYLAAGRPVLALVDGNVELVELLRAHGHLAVRFDDGEGALMDALDTVLRGRLPVPRPSELTAAASVERLVARVLDARGTTRPSGERHAISRRA